MLASLGLGAILIILGIAVVGVGIYLAWKAEQKRRQELAENLSQVRKFRRQIISRTILPPMHWLLELINTSAGPAWNMLPKMQKRWRDVHTLYRS